MQIDGQVATEILDNDGFKYEMTIAEMFLPPFLFDSNTDNTA